jgi:hypothetical protein
MVCTTHMHRALVGIEASTAGGWHHGASSRPGGDLHAVVQNADDTDGAVRRLVVEDEGTAGAETVGAEADGGGVGADATDGGKVGAAIGA